MPSGKVFLSATQTTHSGIGVAAFVFIIYGMTQLRDGPFIRPHPIFWRAVQAVSVVYLMFIVYLSFQALLPSCL